FVSAVTPWLLTRSFVVDPTRLLAAETTPITPVVPLHQVAAPALTMAPLSQLELATTKLPFESAVTPSAPIRSLTVQPTRLLVMDTAPLTPVVPLHQVTAPTSVKPPPLSHCGLRTT